MGLVFPDFVSVFLGSIDGRQVLGESVVSQLILASVDPEPGSVLVHGETVRQQESDVDRLQVCRFQVFANSFQQARDIAEALHSAAVGDGIEFHGSEFAEPAFFDTVRSEQGPVLNQSQGLRSVCFMFDVAAISRPL